MAVVNGYLHALEAGDATAYVALCQPKVGYFNEGLKTQGYIHRSRELFMTHWTDYHVYNLRNVSIRDTSDPATKSVSFTYEWSARSLVHSSKHGTTTGTPKTGTVTDTLDVHNGEGRWLITKMWQDIVVR